MFAREHMEEGSVPTVDKFIRLQAHVFQLIVHKLEIARGPVWFHRSTRATKKSFMHGALNEVYL